jgi:hypothetical protein
MTTNYEAPAAWSDTVPGVSLSWEVEMTNPWSVGLFVIIK